MAPATPGGRAAPNPRDVVDFEDITSIPFSFSRHPTYTDANLHMNTIYGDAFMEMDDLFTLVDPPTRTTFVANPIAIIRDQIWEHSVLPNAVDTTDRTSINPLDVPFQSV